MKSTASAPQDGNPLHAGPEPTVNFVVGCARSGTTLLQHLLEAHPAIGCPGETGLPTLARILGRVWLAVTADGAAVRHLRPPAEVVDMIRRTLLEPVRHYCASGNKAIYCDKSLDTIEFLPLLHDLFPSAKYVLLFRHVMDTVASGLEAQPFGLDGYGYPPYAQKSATNAVEAIASAWNRHVAHALEWDREHPELCRRVFYEELTTSPDEVMSNVLTFLGAEAVPDLDGRAFANPRHTHVTSPGDYKIAWATHVHTESIGRGKRIPVRRLHPSLVAVLNSQLDELGYGQLHERWNMEPWSERGLRTNATSESLCRLMSTWDGRSSVVAGGVTSIAVMADDVQNARWRLSVSGGDAELSTAGADFLLCGCASDLVGVLTGAIDGPTAMWSGRVRGEVGATIREMHNEPAATEVDVGLVTHSVIEALRAGFSAGGGIASPSPKRRRSTAGRAGENAARTSRGARVAS